MSANCKSICEQVVLEYTSMDNEIVFYQKEDASLQINVRVDGETVWLTQAQLVALYQSSKANISEHLKKIFESGELDASSTVRKFRTVATNGKTYNMVHYNLDVIIALGYKIDSQVALKFRQWATARLREYIIKGYTLDEERLKQNGGRYFKELLQKIRDIRSSERNLWQQVTDIYATSVDYDKNAQLTREFFATVQNKMHYAVHQQTAAEVIYNRVSADKPSLGMTNFKGDYITKQDTHIAKNYLDEQELQKLNLLVEQYLGYAELQALEKRPMTMQDWKDELDRQLSYLHRQVLTDKGKISHRQAVQKADRRAEMANYESDFDRAVLEFQREVKQLDEKSG